MNPLLEVREATKNYGAFEALKNVTFDVAEKETFAIIGPNGAGKTTLFRVLTGEVSITSGRVIFMGEDVTNLTADERVRLGIGRTFQVARVFPEYSALDNVIVAIEARNRAQLRRRTPKLRVRPTAEVRDEAMGRLGDLGLVAAERTEARYLSLGDRKRLELALSLALDPIVLMMDEPTAGMSPSERHAIIDLIIQIRQNLGLTIVLTEHNTDLVFQLSDRIMVINQGECVVTGAPSEIRDDPHVREIYLGKEMVDA